MHSRRLVRRLEYRVKEVLEEKLSTILNELGVDKYSDVLDGETAEINFTDAYMNSIRSPKNIEYNVRPAEEDLKRQIKNTANVKDLIREDKDLQNLVGAEMSFDLDDALTRMVVYYENYKGNPVMSIDRYSVNDPVIVRHLKKEITFDAAEPLPSVTIHDFPNEKGFFMLWELIVTDDEQGKRFVPVFINDEGVLRPLAGKKIWEALLDPEKQLSVLSADKLDGEKWETLYAAAQEFAYDTFLALKEEAEQRHEESYRKYMYALELRTEAAKNIGIENIRRHRMIQLMKEKTIVSRNYEASQKLCPEFRPVMVLRME